MLLKHLKKETLTFIRYIPPESGSMRPTAMLFLKNHIIKQKIYNHKPVGFQGFAMNMRKPPFNDINVRQAMALLLDRKKMNQTLMYNQYFLHRSYFEDLYTADHPCPNPLIEMDKAKARELLKKAGWKVNPATGFSGKKRRKIYIPVSVQ